MIVNNQKKLDLAEKAFLRKKYFYLDTEFERKNTFFSKLSIVTISNGKNIFIFDIIKYPEHLNFLKKLFKNKTRTKIIHGGQQDIEIFLNYNLNIEPFYDTQLASGFLGFDKNISYANLVKKYFNINLNKKHQNENWLKRPLSKTQIEYLKNDVKYLSKIYKLQIKILQKQKKINFVKEETKLILQKIKNNKGLNSKFKKKLDPKIYNSSPFINLLKIRDNKAKIENLPKNWVLKDEEIISIIKTKDNSKIRKNKFFTKIEKKELINNLKKVYKITFTQKNNEIELKSLEFFKYLISKKYKIDPNLIASKFDFIEYKKNKTQKNWRFKIFYNDYEKFVSGKKRFKLKDFTPLHQ